MIRATIISGSGDEVHSYGDYDFATLPAQGDTIVVHSMPGSDVVRVLHTEHYPVPINPQPELGDTIKHYVQIFVEWVESAD